MNKNINRNNAKWEVIKSTGVEKQHIYSYHTLAKAETLAKKHNAYSLRGKLTYRGKGLTSKEQKAFINLCYFIKKLHLEADGKKVKRTKFATNQTHYKEAA